MSEEMRTEIITFRKNHDELKANVDKTKVSQPYVLAVSLSFLLPTSLREPSNALPNLPCCLLKAVWCHEAGELQNCALRACFPLSMKESQPARAHNTKVGQTDICLPTVW